MLFGNVGSRNGLPGAEAIPTQVKMSDQSHVNLYVSFILYVATNPGFVKDDVSRGGALKSVETGRELRQAFKGHIPPDTRRWDQ